MDSRVKITKEGGIYMYVPSECVEVMKGYQYDLVCFPMDEPMSIEETDFEDEEVFVNVGTITDLHIERIGLFPTLESVKAYVDMHGRAPWGISAIARRNGWKRVSEKGVSLTLMDKDGRKLKFYRRAGEAEIE